MFIALSALQFLAIFLHFLELNALQCSYFKLSDKVAESNNLNNNFTDNLSDKKLVEQCAHENSFCYSLWHYDVNDPFNTSQYHIVEKGCLYNQRDILCDSSQCISTIKPTGALNIDINHNGNRNARYVILAFVFVLFISAVIIFFILCYKSAMVLYPSSNILNKGKTMDSLNLLESQSRSITPAPFFRSACSINVEDLTLDEIIGKGRYGTVWKGRLGNLTVAIKTVSNENKHVLVNECRIYSLPFMAHSSLPQYYGCQERIMVDNNYIERCMVIEYAHLGSLNSYLKEHTIDWTRFCMMVKTLVQGLAHLHTEITKDGKHKPAIVHRDLSSRNVIIKADGTCMICDFQHAVCFVNNKPLTNEDRVISLVGTLRYLAPEKLDNAFNLSHCESALKQADIYSFGLLLWEMASRCSDLYQGIDVPNYKMPFEHELGLKPTFDQMKVLVSRHKARPLFPDIWKNSNPAIRLLKETIVECWDQEPEARLTALCIAERIGELPILWKRYKMETLTNCCVVSSLQQQLKEIQCNLNGNISNNNNNVKHQDVCNNNKLSTLNDSIDSKYACSNYYINKFENSLHYKYNSQHYLLHHPYHNHHFHQLNVCNIKKQDNSTIEKNMHAAANMSVKSIQPKLTLPLQPHQARNPCIERNLMLETSDEHDGLLEQGLKFQTKPLMNANVTNINGHNETRDEDLNYSETRNLIRTTLPLPISYVQNPVRSTANESNNRTKDVNKFQNCNKSVQLMSKISLLEYIKQKLNLSNVGNQQCSQNQCKTTTNLTTNNVKRLCCNQPNISDNGKENRNENNLNINAELDHLLYAQKEAQCSNNETNGLDDGHIYTDDKNLSTRENNGDNSTLALNSSSMISNEHELSLKSADYTIIMDDKNGKLVDEDNNCNHYHNQMGTTTTNLLNATRNESHQLTFRVDEDKLSQQSSSESHLNESQWISS
ncbi:Bone morphogenetic protein receptor type-2 [Blomia tropicalis]|nr:Bone morphogenetic protein receptor type-2 [Blomia tropicalis]